MKVFALLFVSLILNTSFALADRQASPTEEALFCKGIEKYLREDGADEYILFDRHACKANSYSASTDNGRTSVYGRTPVLLLTMVPPVPFMIDCELEIENNSVVPGSADCTY